MARRGDYLFRRRGSQNWYIKLQYPPRLRETMTLLMDTRDVKKAVERSLGTSDRVEAEALAAPLIAQHKHLLMVHAARTRAPSSFILQPSEYETEPGRHNAPDGTVTVAKGRHLTVVSPDGTIIRRPNRKRIRDYRIVSENLPPPLRRELTELIKREKPVENIDAEIVEAYIAENNKNAEDAKLTRDTLAIFKAISGNKSLAACGRDDVKKLVQHLSQNGGKRRTGLSMGTIKRAIAGLKAAVNLELKADHPRLIRNVFASVTIDASSMAARIPYSEKDVAKVREHFNDLDPDERLMWVWHVSSGVRPNAIFSIVSEEWEEAEDPETGEKYRTRHVRIRSDKDKHKGKRFGPRNLPIPQSVLDLNQLPDRINGPLFKRERKTMLATLNRKLEAMGVNATGKTLYSGRHRAVDRMTNREVPREQRQAILGHAREGIEGRYGHGLAMWRLKAFDGQNRILSSSRIGALSGVRAPNRTVC